MGKKLPSYRPHSTRDKAFFVIPNSKGKRKYLPGKFDSPESRAAYEREMRKLRVSAVRSSIANVTADTATLGHLSNAFLAHCATRWDMDDPRSVFHDYKRAVARVVGSDGLGLHALPAKDFGPRRLKELQTYLIGEGLARSTINGICSKVRTWIKWCVSEELADASTWHALQSVAGLEKGQTDAAEPPPRLPVSWADVQPVFRWLQPTVRDMLWLQWYTGARSRSICEAKPEQFANSDRLWLWKPRHKTERKKTVVLPLGPRCFAHVRNYVLSESEYCFSPRAGRRGSNRRYRAAYDKDSYRQSIQRAIKKACEYARQRKNKHPETHVPQPWTPHQLRHARGTLVRERYGVEAAASILGHANVSTTELYTAKAIESACRVALEMG